MAALLDPSFADMGDWPDEAEETYERVEILGKGSFGMVWMARRMERKTTKSQKAGNNTNAAAPAADAAADEEKEEDNDEYVAIKTIRIKDEKGTVYAEREIGILQELRHPHVIRLIRSYPLCGDSRLVVMQLARGPNLHHLVVKRGALGVPLGRLVSRQLIAAVSYLHGRAVIHRDIKPSNCILACTVVPPTLEYDWLSDDAIWSNQKDCQEAVDHGRWKLMLVDFGFARALEREEIMSQANPLRNSIVFESQYPSTAASSSAPAKTHTQIALEAMHKEALAEKTIKEEELSEEEDESKLAELAEQAAAQLSFSFQANNHLEDEIMGQRRASRLRASGVSMPIPDILEEGDETEGGSNAPVSSSSGSNGLRKSQRSRRPSSRNGSGGSGGGGGGFGLRGSFGRRPSSARKHIRSMSALGTKAYAAPEIRKKLRHKTEEDFDKANAAMTECVADYGMIVDSYSVGWTLRVALTGVPPNFTISEYMRERSTVIMATDSADFSNEVVDGCCCFKAEYEPSVRIRDPSMIPYEATTLIASLTEKKPEDRITVREAQNHPWIAGGPNETKYVLPQGNVPSRHGDPVVPLDCAPALSRITMAYHMQ